MFFLILYMDNITIISALFLVESKIMPNFALKRNKV